jgi:hypothetical protein
VQGEADQSCRREGRRRLGPAAATDEVREKGRLDDRRGIDQTTIREGDAAVAYIGSNSRSSTEGMKTVSSMSDGTLMSSPSSHSRRIMRQWAASLLEACRHK